MPPVDDYGLHGVVRPGRAYSGQAFLVRVTIWASGESRINGVRLYTSP